MKQRCLNPNHTEFRNYGGRGIKIDQTWEDSFQTFYRDMGPRPSPQHTIERINNDGPYAPGNCKWATKTEQMGNTRRNSRLEYAGRNLTKTEWSKELNIAVPIINYRLGLGWSIERTLSTPKHPRLSRSTIENIKRLRIAGLTYTEIAAATRTPFGTVSSILQGIVHRDVVV